MTDGRVCIGVFPDVWYDRQGKLLAALQDLAHVRFQSGRDAAIEDFRFVILANPADELLERASRCGIRALVYGGAGGPVAGEAGVMAFADREEIDRSLRGEQFAEPGGVDQCILRCYPGDAVLATRAGAPVWVRRYTDGAMSDRVAIEPRPLGDGELLRERLRANAVSELVPLIQFVREVAGAGDWEQPPPRACFVIDDPSLYWPSYGYVEFARLAECAARLGCHVAIATIPLDTWRVHPEVARILSRHANHLSLLVHGNNHTHLEMAREEPEDSRRAQFAQALRRFERLRRHPGLQLSRVVEPPYGVIDGAAARLLASLGYQAMLYTPSQFIICNRSRPWPTSLGAVPVDVAPHGLAAIPRLVMSRHWRSEVAIAAFLRQPIVLAGHHQDFFAGLGLLEKFSSHVNRLGNVKWLSPAAIARSLCMTRREGDGWIVRVGARTIDCEVPAGVRRLVIERPWVDADGEALEVHRGYAMEQPLRIEGASASHELSWEGRGSVRVTLSSPISSPIDPDSVAPPPQRLWPILRKIMVEGRDRLYPYLPERLVRRLRARISC